MLSASLPSLNKLFSALIVHVWDYHESRVSDRWILQDARRKADAVQVLPVCLGPGGTTHVAAIGADCILLQLPSQPDFNSIL